MIMNAKYTFMFLMNCLDDNKIYEYSFPHDPDLDIQLGVLLLKRANSFSVNFVYTMPKNQKTPLPKRREKNRYDTNSN